MHLVEEKKISEVVVKLYLFQDNNLEKIWIREFSQCLQISQTCLI